MKMKTAVDLQTILFCLNWLRWGLGVGGELREAIQYKYRCVANNGLQTVLALFILVIYCESNNVNHPCVLSKN